MAFVSFRRADGGASYGTLDGGRISISAQRQVRRRSQGGDHRGTLATLTSDSHVALADVTLLPVLPNPGKILCVGHNYESHRQETGRAKVDNPSIFTRFADTLVAHGQPIIVPKISTDSISRVNWRSSSAPAAAIPEADALSHIAGFACFNDASVRDWQWHTSQFAPGKNFPGTARLARKW